MLIGTTDWDVMETLKENIFRTCWEPIFTGLKFPTCWEVELNKSKITRAKVFLHQLVHVMKNA